MVGERKDVAAPLNVLKRGEGLIDRINQLAAVLGRPSKATGESTVHAHETGSNDKIDNFFDFYEDSTATKTATGDSVKSETQNDFDLGTILHPLDDNKKDEVDGAEK